MSKFEGFKVTLGIPPNEYRCLLPDLHKIEIQWIYLQMSLYGDKRTESEGEEKL